MSRTRFITAILTPILVTLLLAGCATPAGKSTPAITTDDPLRLANPRAGFVVTLRAEHETLRIGDPLRLHLRTTAAGYLNLYFISSSDKTGQLLTNYPVRANETVPFPPVASKRLRYAPTPPAGAETFILVVTHKPLNLLSRQDIRNAAKPRTALAEFNMTGAQLVERLRGALRRWPPSDWNADSARLPLLAADARS